MDNSVEKQSTRSWVSDALIITAFPVVAYLASFIYEAGFCSYFGIPTFLIDINLSTVCYVGVIWFVSILLLYVAGELLFQLWPKGHAVHPIYSKLTYFIPLFLYIIMLLFLFGIHWREWITSVTFILVFLLMDLLSPFVTQRGKGTYRDKLIAQEEGPGPKALAGEIIKRLGISASIIIWVLIMGFSITHAIGRAIALNQSEFLVITTSSEMVVLRAYGDKLLCAPFDRTKKEVKRTFSILKIAEDSNLKLSLEEVGPLHMEKEPTEVLKKSISAPTDSLEGLKKK